MVNTPTLAGADFGFCPELAKLLQKQTIVGKTGRVFRDPGAHSTLGNLNTIRELLREIRAERTLEVGLCFGGSTLLFCATHQELGHSPQCQHTAIDPYQTTTWDSC